MGFPKFDRKPATLYGYARRRMKKAPFPVVVVAGDQDYVVGELVTIDEMMLKRFD